jgi:hypothetical protein
MLLDIETHSISKISNNNQSAQQKKKKSSQEKDAK